jgi:hypothetical protein
LPTSFYWKPPISNFNKICDKVYGVCGEDQLWFYVNYASLWLTDYDPKIEIARKISVGVSHTKFKINLSNLGPAARSQQV